MSGPGGPIGATTTADGRERMRRSGRRRAIQVPLWSPCLGAHGFDRWLDHTPISRNGRCNSRDGRDGPAKGRDGHRGPCAQASLACRQPTVAPPTHDRPVGRSARRREPPERKRFGAASRRTGESGLSAADPTCRAAVPRRAPCRAATAPPRRPPSAAGEAASVTMRRNVDVPARARGTPSLATDPG